MGGIAGILSFDNALVPAGLIESMTFAMRSRGPDGIRHWQNGSIALGQCMLRTTPESLEETQPWSSVAEHLVLVMDGRVDNWQELRKELLALGATLRNRSDAELVLQAYQLWGEACLNRIIGEFVFFIWDECRQSLFAGRDAAGTRHFYYHAGKSGFYFASEIKGLLATRLIKCEINESRILDYLVPEYDRDDEVGTFYKNICRLPAGHALRVSSEGLATWRYWHPGRLSVASFSSPDECAEAYLEQLRIAVHCRLRSIGPVAAALSGGLDSSSIVGLIRKEFRNELETPLRTYSLVGADRENCLDWASIKEMLRDGWIEPTIIASDLDVETCRRHIEGIDTLDNPFTLSNGLTYSILCDAAQRDGCRVLLDGMAGDLLFYSLAQSVEKIHEQRLASYFPGLVVAYCRHASGYGLAALTKKSLALIAPESLLARYRKYRYGREWMKGDCTFLHPGLAKHFLAERGEQRAVALQAAESGNDQFSHARCFTTGLLSFGQEVHGEIALSAGVEPRSPFADRRLIEFAIRMPLAAKLSAPWYKYLARKSMAGVLPETVRWRREIGVNPMWKFHERFISALAQGFPEIWNPPRLSASLSPWVADQKLDQEWQQYDPAAAYSTGIRLFNLMILGRWLTTRE